MSVCCGIIGVGCVSGSSPKVSLSQNPSSFISAQRLVFQRLMFATGVALGKCCNICCVPVRFSSFSDLRGESKLRGESIIGGSG